jgi:hypothetical protein
VTHDELLARVQSNYEENKHFRDQPDWKSFAALRAVVKLHKPHEYYSQLDNKTLLGLECACLCVYPCPTIQAIEKELV